MRCNPSGPVLRLLLLRTMPMQQTALAIIRFGVGRGDKIVYVGKDSPGGSQLQEIIFGVMVFEHRSQQNRYIISYDTSLEEFSVGPWTSWRRMPAGACATFDRTRMRMMTSRWRAKKRRRR